MTRASAIFPINEQEYGKSSGNLQKPEICYNQNFLFAVIPAKLVLDLIGEQESNNIMISQWIPAFAGMTK
jgi:hypothetical protein